MWRAGGGLGGVALDPVRIDQSYSISGRHSFSHSVYKVKLFCLLTDIFSLHFKFAQSHNIFRPNRQKSQKLAVRLPAHLIRYKVYF